MTAIKKLIDGNGNQYFPQTHTKAVVDDNGNVLDNTISNLQALYNGLTQNDVVIVPEGSWPLSNLQQNTIYRVAGSTSYSDYIYNGTTAVLMATYDNAIDDTPTENSSNLVKSGGVYNLYAKTVTLLDRNVTNRVSNIPISMTVGKTYTIVHTKESSAYTECVLKDSNGTSINLYKESFKDRTTTYTPTVAIVSISFYSSPTGHFLVYCDNDDKVLLTHDDVINSLTDGGTSVPLSAEKGKELNDNTFFLHYYYYPVSSGDFPTSVSDANLGKNINSGRAIIPNQNIVSLSVKDGYEFRIYGKADNVRSSNSFTTITSGYIRDKWVNTSSANYLWIMLRKTDISVIDCNELNSILMVEYDGAKTQFNKIYTQEDLYRLGRREDIAVSYVNGYVNINYGTRTESESASDFISEYIDVANMIALSFRVSSNYSATNQSPSLPVLWYDSNKTYIGHTNIQILQKDMTAIIGVPDNAYYAVFSSKRTVEAIYRQDAVEALHRIGYKSVLGKLKKVSLIICHGQSLMVGADSTHMAERKIYDSLINFRWTSGADRVKGDSDYSGFTRMYTALESPRHGMGEMFFHTISKENNISVEANDWENHYLLMPSPAVGNTTIETLSGDSEYEYVEAHIRNAKRFCDEFGYELDAPAWVWFQGENNLGDAKDTYKAALLALHEKICGSLTEIAGITTRPKCIIYQPSNQCIQSTQAAAYGYSNGRLGVPTAFAELLAENDEFIAAAPTYILTPATSGGIYIHCDAESYNLLGAYAGYALKKYLIDGINVKGVIPLSYTVSGNTVKIKYNVPSPPLCVDTNWVREVAHYGYTCVKSDDTDIVTDVSVYWDTVTITCSESPVGCKLRYGLNGDRVYSADGYYGWSGRIYGGRGNIRDNQGNAICKEMPNGKIYPMHNWAYCFEKVLE